MLEDDRPYLGLMSGTSMDGVDAVLVRFRGSQTEVAAHHALNMPSALREKLTAIVHQQAASLPELLQTERDLADLYARASLELLDQCSCNAGQIAAIGSHGQTICHRPDLGETLQVGDPSRIAELTGITTVADFRRRDLAASGQGAPLAPAFHASAMHSTAEDRAIVNLGGIANVTWLASDTNVGVIGFDTGPANTLLDHWTAEHLGMPFDEDGQWARSGTVHEELLRVMLEDPYISAPPPKSTGREHFNPAWLQARLSTRKGIQAEDVQTTLTELTAISVARNITNFCGQSGGLYACGGGARNAFLLERIAIHLPGFRVGTTDELGVPAQLVEAIAFAWLARQTLNGLPGNLPSVTGANREVILGGIFPGTSHT